MTSTENPYFAKVIVNRVWAEMMGRGIVDPVDDLRATNPPSNGPLLDALADDFRRHGYDLKHLIRTIMSSSVYALGSAPKERNLADTRNFSRHYRQRLRAEVLLDAIVGRDRRARQLRGGTGWLAILGDLDAPGAVVVPRHLRPARPEPGPALRADHRHLRRPGAAPDECARPEPEGHQRRRPRRATGKERAIATRRSSRNCICSRTHGVRPRRR